MEPRIDEITAGIYRISIFVPEVAPPLGFTYNHFLILATSRYCFTVAQKDVPACVQRHCQDHPRRSVALADLWTL
jgi:hypothetical protein